MATFSISLVNRESESKQYHLILLDITNCLLFLKFNNLAVPQNVQYEVNITQKFPSYVYISENWNIQKLVYECILGALSIIVKK